MKLLILGGHGMAGHMIVSYFQRRQQYEVFYTSRDKQDRNSIYLDVTSSTALEELIHTLQPDIVINCIGILNENAAQNPTLAFQVNSLLPHQLKRLTERYQGRLIHISTDCVFSGKKGNYTETDFPDGTSIYAQSKQLGEVTSDQHVTVRTSIIGPERKNDGIGLFLWFMKQTGTIQGYDRVMWNGVTTLELAKAIEAMIAQHVTGLYHLTASTSISKYELLKLIQRVYSKNDVEVLRDTAVVQDRTLKNTRTDFQYNVPGYEEMLIQLRDWTKLP